MSISCIVLIRFLHPFIWGLCGRKPKCFPVSLGVLEFSGDPNARVKIDLAQRLTVQEEEMTLCILTCICMNLGSWVTEFSAICNIREKQRWKRWNLQTITEAQTAYWLVQDWSEKTVHSSTFIPGPISVYFPMPSRLPYFHKCQYAWLCGDSIASWSSQKKPWWCEQPQFLRENARLHPLTSIRMEQAMRFPCCFYKEALS